MSSRQKLRVAYVLRSFPDITGNFVFDEVAALRTKGVDVSIFAGIESDDTDAMTDLTNLVPETTYLRPFKATLLLKACWLSLLHINHLKDIYMRVLFGGNEGILRRIKALLHSIAGIYLALLLKNREITHIHANHGGLRGRRAASLSIPVRNPRVLMKYRISIAGRSPWIACG